MSTDRNDLAAFRADASPTVRRFTSPDGRVRVTLRAPAFVDGRWWSCLERDYAAGQGLTAPHRHDESVEIHVVRSGVVRFLQGWRFRTATAGEVIHFPAGRAHMDPWAFCQAATVTTYIGPPSSKWVGMGVLIGEMTEREHLTSRGQPPLDSFMRAVHECGVDILAAGLPTFLQRSFTIPAIAAVARWRCRGGHEFGPTHHLSNLRGPLRSRGHCGRDPARGDQDPG